MECLKTRILTLFSIVSFSFNRFQIPLFMTLFGKLLIPTIYKSCRVYILGSIPDETVINVIVQMVWVTVIMEIIEEALLMPLYHCFGEAVARGDHNSQLIPKVRSGFFVCFLFYLGFCGVIAIFTPELIEVMGINHELGPETAKYIRLELVGVFLTGIMKLYGIVLVIKGRSLYLNIILIVQLVCAVLSDTFFFSNLSVSLKLGSRGVAYSSIIQQFVSSLFTFILAAVSLRAPIYKLLAIKIADFTWLNLWTRQGLYSGLESFIRNTVYLVIVLRGMNLLHEQDIYWIGDNFIWSWLLIPVLALSELLRQDVATSHPKEEFHVIIPAYCCICVGIVVVWGVTVPGWHWFIVTVLNAGDRSPGVITRLVFQLMAGYLFFIVSHLNRSVVYAKGKIQYLCVTSLAASVFMVALFLLVILDIIPATLQIIAGIFSANMVVGSMVSVVMVKYMLLVLRRERNVD